MREDTGKLLEKAARTILAAETLLRGGHTESSAGRAYYAMFYVACLDLYFAPANDLAESAQTPLGLHQERLVPAEDDLRLP